MSILNNSQAPFLWDEVKLNATLSAKFSDVINDDFLIVDGIMDDFTGLLDIDATSMFDQSMVDCSSHEGKDEEPKEEVREEEKVKSIIQNKNTRNERIIKSKDISTMSILNESQETFFCGEVDTSTSLSAKSSDIINDNFLTVDGLMEDFTELLDIDATSIFGETASIINDSMCIHIVDLSSNEGIDEEKEETASEEETVRRISFSSNEGKDEEKKEEVCEEEKVRKVRKDRSRSPISKRRRSITHTDTTPTLHALPPKKSLEDLQEQYELAVQQFTASMRRSELTRLEIANYRQASETRAKLQAAQARQFDCTDGFLTGSRSTLTTGLEHSRKMLRGYMNLMPTPAL
jgi:hypothetical protein